MMKRFTQILFVLATVFAVFSYGHAASAECQLYDIYPQIGLNKAITQIPVPYSEDENLVATVKTKNGFNCEGFKVEFRACPIGFTGTKCDTTDGALVLANPGPAIVNSKATISWTVKKLRTDYDKYRLRAVVGTGVGNGVSQVYSPEIIIKSGQVCAITNFSATRIGNAGPFSFIIKSNDKCEGKESTVQLMLQPGGANAQIPGDIVAKGVIKNNQFSASWTGTPSTKNIFFKGAISGGGTIDYQMFLDGQPAPVPGTTVCGNKICEVSETSATCPADCTVIPGTAPQSYYFNITNPLKGGPNDLFDIINIVTQWIMYISIPLAVLYIMYAGFLMLTAGPTPANFQKGRDILKYVVLGLAIIFIGKGFVSLIISVIELGGTTSTENSSPSLGAPTGEGSSNSGQQYQNVLTVKERITAGGQVN